MNSRRLQRGQGMTEYITIVALIGVAAIGVFMLFGNTIREQTAGLAREISGQDAQTQITRAGGAANAAATQANTTRSLSTYNNQAGDGAVAGGAVSPP